MTIKSELEALQRADGLLRAEDAVEWARNNPASDLYRELEWNDAVAGHAHRIWQVRRLIALHIVNEVGTRQMVSLTVDRTNPGGGYRSTQDVMQVPALREVMLADALTELERVRKRYQSVVELARVWVEVDRVRSRQAEKMAEQADAIVGGA